MKYFYLVWKSLWRKKIRTVSPARAPLNPIVGPITVIRWDGNKGAMGPTPQTVLWHRGQAGPVAHVNCWMRSAAGRVKRNDQRLNETT